MDVRKHFRMANGRVSQGWLPLERLPFLGNLRKMVLFRPEGWKVALPVRRSQVPGFSQHMSEKMFPGLPRAPNLQRLD